RAPQLLTVPWLLGRIGHKLRGRSASICPRPLPWRTRPVVPGSLNSTTANLPTRRLHQACFRCHAPVRARDLASPTTHLDSIQGRLAHLTWPRWSKELDDAPRGTRGGPLRAAPE